MSRISMVLVVLAFPAFGDEKPAKRTPKFTVSPSTTRVTEPLDEDGYVDYAAALNKHFGKSVTIQNNANVLLWQAMGPHPDGIKKMDPAYFKWLGVEIPPEQGDYFVPLQRHAREVLKIEKREQLNQFHERFTRHNQRPWSAKEQPEFAGWLKANEKPLKLVVEATKRSEYFNPIVVRRSEKGSHSLISALLPSVQVCREMGNALAARAMLHTGEGRFAEAWQDLLACHRLGRLVSRGCTLIELLVGIAIDNIASSADLTFIERTTFSLDQLQGCRNDLLKLPLMSDLAEKLDRGERYMTLDVIQLIERHGFDSLESGSLSPPKKEMTARERASLDRLDWDLMMRNANSQFARLVAIHRVENRSERMKLLDGLNDDDRERASRMAASKENLKGLKGLFASPKELSQFYNDLILGMMLPANQKVQQSFDKAEQTQRNLHLALALAAYHKDHKSYPKQLADLKPKYLKEIPEDLFSGKPLIYKPSESGYLLYSVGVNGRDEEGRGQRDEAKGDDLSIQIPQAELPKK